MSGRLRDLLAGAVVVLALLLPASPSQLTAAAVVAVPVEALVGVGVLLVLPRAARRPAALVAAVALGLLSIVKLLDLGFRWVLSRPFDPVIDWVLLGDAMNFLRDTLGPQAATVAVVVGLAAGLALAVLVAGSVLRVGRLVERHDATAGRTVAVLALLWVTAAGLNVRVAPGVPLAARSTATLVADHARQARASWQDRQGFLAQIGRDTYAGVPPGDLLTGLRGKDVVVAFVESYGRTAVEDPGLGPGVQAVLAAGSDRLRAAGYSSRSAFLTSPTSGGGSWLAHTTLLSGLWVDDQQRYRDVVSSERLTLSGAFRRAGWRTVGVMPGVTSAWPEGDFFSYQEVHDADHLGYRGPNFSWSRMPDQYTLAAFDRLERSRAPRAPVMAVVPLVSSHAPWSPVPRLVEWPEVGDGSVFSRQTTPGGDPPSAILTRDPERVRADYRRSVEYSLQTLVGYLETQAGDDLVMIILGDHQPSPIVTGPDAGREVPVSIVARDPAVLRQLAGWRWSDGLRPRPSAPVWPMDTFRDRFLATFGGS